MKLSELLVQRLYPRPPASDSENEELGQILAASFISDIIHREDIPIEVISEDFIAEMLKHIQTLEAKKVEDIVIERALHKAARGDFKEAGRIFREYMWNGAENIFNKKMAPDGITLQKNRRKGALEKSRRIQMRNFKIRQDYDKQVSEGKSRHRIYRQLQEQYGIGLKQLYKILKLRRKK